MLTSVSERRKQNEKHQNQNSKATHKKEIFLLNCLTHETSRHSDTAASDPTCRRVNKYLCCVFAAASDARIHLGSPLCCRKLSQCGRRMETKNQQPPLPQHSTLSAPSLPPVVAYFHHSQMKHLWRLTPVNFYALWEEWESIGRTARRSPPARGKDPSQGGEAAAGV